MADGLGLVLVHLRLVLGPSASLGLCLLTRKLTHCSHPTIRTGFSFLPQMTVDIT